MQNHPSLIGRVLGEYRVEEEIGRGGMGIVYKAHEATLQRTVALKVLPADLARDDVFVKRFVREARAAARLSHPNIVAVYGVGQSDGAHYIAMEYVDGRSLARLVREQGALGAGQALDIARQAAEALAHAHKHGIIHRDIKPENIMVDESGRVKLMDFGLARALQSQSKLTADGTRLGTPLYMSPEQVNGEPLDARTDIYSLGVVLYEMLTGTAPFAADTPLSLMYQITHKPFPDVSDVNPSVPEVVAQVVADATAREPERRYPSAQILAAHLASLQKQVSLVPAPSSPSSAQGVDVPSDPVVLDAALRSEIIGEAVSSSSIQEAGSKPRHALWTRRNRIILGVAAGALIAAIAIASLMRGGGGSSQKGADVPEQDPVPITAGAGVVHAVPGETPDLSFLDSIGDGELQELDLRSARIDDGALARIATAAGLKKLDLEQTPVTDIGLEHLAGLRKLEVLDLENTAVSDSGLVHLAGLTRIKDLNLAHTLITKDGLSHLASLGALTRLDLASNGIGEADIRELQTALPNCTILIDARAPGERYLRFPADSSVGTLTTKDWAAVVSRVKYGGDWQAIGAAQGSVRVGAGVVVTLSLTLESCTDLSWMTALGPADVDVLHFPEDLPSLGDLQAIEHLRALYRIRLHNVSLGDAEWRSLSKLPAIRSLTLDNTGTTDARLAYLQSFRRLELLSFDENAAVTDAGLSHLVDLPVLKHLYLSGTAVSDRGVRLLTALPLETIVLERAPVTDACIPYLAGMKTLRKVWLGQTQVTPSGIARLRAQLPGCDASI